MDSGGSGLAFEPQTQVYSPVEAKTIVNGSRSDVLVPPSLVSRPDQTARVLSELTLECVPSVVLPDRSKHGEDVAGALC